MSTLSVLAQISEEGERREREEMTVNKRMAENLIILVWRFSYRWETK